MDLTFIRRDFDFKAGATTASNSLICVLKSNFDLTVLCESGAGCAVEDVSFVSFKKINSSRARSLKAFVNQTMHYIANNKGYVHSHEFIPGADVIRLGDGLHSQWLDLRDYPKWWRSIEPFHRYRLSIERQSLEHKNLKKIIVNSNFIRKAIESRYPSVNVPIHLIRNIVRENFYNEEPDFTNVEKARLLFVGSGWHRKGLKNAILTLQYLPDEWVLDVLGDDKKKSKYVNLAFSLGLEQRVNFLGALKATPQMYQKASVLIHPAVYEPFPNVATEALSQGVPVVSTKFSGTSDFTQHEGVWTVDNVPEQLAHAVKKASLSSAKQRKSYRDHMCQFDLKYLEKELAEVYKNLK